MGEGRWPGATELAWIMAAPLLKWNLSLEWLVVSGGDHCCLVWSRDPDSC